MEKQGLTPNADAPPARRLRRAWFTLVGLPPPPEEIRAFEADPSEAAFAAVVDRLLASPQFGERWGRHWLDIARYADSSGGGRSKVFPEAWRYRDYVIDAFNRDKPFDQFVREQLAGDLLPHTDAAERAENLTATGYLLLAPTNFENQDKEALELDVADEQLDALGRAFMGMTIGCARCHDHKFDPVSNLDYHALAGIFMATDSLRHSNVSDVRTEDLPGAAELAARHKDHQAARKRIDRDIVAARKAVAAAREGRATAPRPSEWPGIVVDDSEAEVVGEWTRSTFVSGHIGPHYLHDNGGRKNAWRVEYSRTLTEGVYEVRASHTPSGNRASRVPFTIAHADGTNTVEVDQRVAPPIDRTWIPLGRYRFAADAPARITLVNADKTGVVIADAVQFVAVADIESAPAVATDSNTSRVAELEAELKRLEAERKALDKTKPPPLPKVMAVGDRANPDDMARRVRGQPHQLGDPVPRGFLEVIAGGPDIPADQSGRLQLAEWLVSPEHPLTSRVMANRVWHHVFGHGIVRSTDNFGATGERPSNPELLDHLALRLREGGWSVKSLVRELVLSRAFALGGGIDPGSHQVDPENRLHWRYSPRRIEAEALRDAMLSVSGLLDDRVGGPGAKVSSVFAHKFTDTRRSVYQPVFRNNIHPMFSVFDVADPNLVTGRRSASTLPTQALFMMNHPQVAEWAAAAAKRFEAMPESERLDAVYLACFARPPRPGERGLADEYLGDDPGPDAWTTLVHTLFASAEFAWLR